MTGQKHIYGCDEPEYPDMTCVRTFAFVHEAQCAANTLVAHRMVPQVDYSEWLQLWCVRVQTCDARAAYSHIRP